MKKPREMPGLRCLTCEYAKRLSQWTVYCPFFSCFKAPAPPRGKMGSG